jgi:hypothetical protein
MTAWKYNGHPQGSASPGIPLSFLIIFMPGDVLGWHGFLHDKEGRTPLYQGLVCGCFACLVCVSGRIRGRVIVLFFQWLLSG